jgi:CRISPR-associated protein Csx17
MTLHIHHLTGCTPTPLAHYLKALGILRLVAEQKDPAARLWWQDEHAVLATKLDRDTLLAFFADDYQPTPILAPWNGGSGFYPKDTKTGIDLLANSKAMRLTPYRDAIKLSKALTNGRTESPKDEEKQKLLCDCRQQWRQGALAWLDAAVVVDESLKPAYPALLGTGGNDGRLDFTNNFMQRLTELFDMKSNEATATMPARTMLAEALFPDTPVRCMSKGYAIGQFHPGGTGGANSTTGFNGDSMINPWDFILMLEGSMLFASAISRRMTPEALPVASAPFAVFSQSSGFGSATTKESSARGEQWMPLWNAPASYHDIASMMMEGRLQLADHPATRPVDVARAIARLGTSRGVTAFERFGYLERNGQANLAVPIGRWQVESQPHRDLADHAASWIDRLSSKARGDSSQAWQSAARRCEEALMAVCQYGHDARRWEELLLSLGAAENTLARTSKKAHDAYLRPLNNLPGAWLQALPPSIELRLATALANQYGINPDGSVFWGEPIRIHSLPCDWNEKFKRWDTKAFTERASVETVAGDGDFQRSAAAILRRRLLVANGGLFPLRAGHGHFAHPADIAAFLRGDVDDAKLWALAQALMAINWRETTPLYPKQDQNADKPPPLYGLLRLAHLPESLRLAGTEIRINTDPAMISSLLAGNVSRGMDIAIRRLTAAGLRPFLRTTIADSTLAKRLAASLLFPVSSEQATRLAMALCKPTVSETHNPAEVSVTAIPAQRSM